jgi:hypothetical protein
VAQNMERELKNAVDARVKQQVMDKLVDTYARPRHSGGTGQAGNRCASPADVPAVRRRRHRRIST